MNLQEQNLINLLRELKEDYYCLGVKSEFETEGAKPEEVHRLSEFASIAGLELSVKLGGCQAMRDLDDAKNVGAKNIIAPMIESTYAMEKYVKSVDLIYGSKKKQTNLYINIETIQGYENIDKILNSNYANDVSGIIMGRTDFIGSLGLIDENINNNEIFEFAKQIAQKSDKFNKEFIIGGGISCRAISFLKNLLHYNLAKFETRKIIFNKNILESNKVEKGINKAIEFEILWIKNRINNYGIKNNLDELRIKKLELLIENCVKL